MGDAFNEHPTVKSPAEITGMRAACRLSAEALRHTMGAIRPGITTGELDRIAHTFIVDRGGTPASLGYRGFPRSICTSVNDVACHGIPSDNERLEDGDIINVDIAAILDGWHGDNSATVPVCTCSDEAMRLLRVSRECMEKAIGLVRPGLRLRELGGVIEDHASSNGFFVVKEYVGHGIGRGYHESPEVLHFRNSEPCIRLRPGMTFTIEPMVNAGSPAVRTDADGWTVRTIDGSLSAQFEHTILVTENGHEVLTMLS